MQNSDTKISDASFSGFTTKLKELNNLTSLVLTFWYFFKYFRNLSLRINRINFDLIRIFSIQIFFNHNSSEILPNRFPRFWFF